MDASLVKLAGTTLGTALCLVLLAYPCLADPPSSDEVEITVQVEPVFAIHLRKDLFAGSEWTSTSTTLGFADFEAGEKELLHQMSDSDPPNPTGRIWYQSNANGKITFELDSGGNFESGGLELWVKQGSSSYIKAEEGTAKLLLNIGATMLSNRRIHLKIDNITWENTAPGTYTESLIFTIQEP